MFNYFFKNVNTLFLTCALAFISIANAQMVRVVNEKGTMGTFFKPTRAELYIGGTVNTEITFAGRGIFVPFTVPNEDTNIGEIAHYQVGNLNGVNNNFIRVEEFGYYKVSYRVTAERVLNDPRIDGGNGAGIEYSLYRQSIGQGPARVPGSYSCSYHTDFYDGAGTASASKVMALVAGDKLYVHAKIYFPTSTPTDFKMKLDANGSSFLVERIK